MVIAVLILGVIGLPSVEPIESRRQSTSVTFGRDIAPIVFESCSPCHRPGESAPFSLLSYQDVRKRARQIVDVTESGYMPPWLPRAGYGSFEATRALTDEQIATIRDWVKNGAPAGDLSSLSPPDRSPGWQLGEPDLVVQLDIAFDLESAGRDVFRNFVIPIPLTEKRYVKAVELRPGNPRIVHHAVMQIDRTGSCRRLDLLDASPGFPGMEMGESEAPRGHLLSWTPGQVPQSGLDKMSWELEPGSDLVLQLHMVPSGKPERIQPRVGFFFANEPPVLRPQVIVLRENDIDIAPGDDDHRIVDRFELPVDVSVLSIYPHAHYLGKEMKVWAELPGGKRQWLLWIPEWDFNWQDLYRYASPVSLPAGTTLVMEFSYDNSADNVRNPNSPPRRVVHGGRSVDEMGNLAIQVLCTVSSDDARLEEAKLKHIADDPSNSRAWLANNGLAGIYESRGQLSDARDRYERAIRLKPDNFRAHNNLGVLLRDSGEFDGALKHFEAALTVDPESHEVLNNMGVALATQGQSGEALVRFQQALAHAPESAELHNNIGNVLGEDLDGAVSHYERAVAIRPDYAEALNNLGIALAKQGRVEEAIQRFKQAVRADGSFRDARRNLEILQEAIRQRQ